MSVYSRSSELAEPISDRLEVRVGFLKAHLGSSGISEILHLNFLSSQLHELKRRETRAVRLVFNFAVQVFW